MAKFSTVFLFNALLIFGACSLVYTSSLYACKRFNCNVPDVILHNISLYEDLSNYLILNKNVLKNDFTGFYSNTIQFKIENVSEKNNNLGYLKELVKRCNSLKIRGFTIDENNNIYYFFEGKSSFFQGFNLEKRLIYLNSYIELFNEDQQIKDVCKVTVSEKFIYVVEKVSN